MNQAVDFGLLLAGGVLLYSAFSGKSLGAVVSGTAAPAGSSSPPGSIAGVGKTITGLGGSAPGSGTVVGFVTWAELTAIGAVHGWSGSQLTDWANIINAESNGTINDTNPTSGAYGIAQMYTGSGGYVPPAQNAQKYYSYGGNPNTVTGQLTAMANYIADRYGTPSAAWTFHQANNAY